MSNSRVTTAQITAARNVDQLCELAQRLPSPFNHLRTGRTSRIGVISRPVPSADTVRAELMLQRAAAYDQSETRLNRLRIELWMHELTDLGIVKTYYRTNGRHLVQTSGTIGERAYTLGELEALCNGAFAVIDR